MCTNPYYNPNPDPDFFMRKELVESIARLNAWIFDEITIVQENKPMLLKQIKKMRDKLPINL